MVYSPKMIKAGCRAADIVNVLNKLNKLVENELILKINIPRENFLSILGLQHSRKIIVLMPATISTLSEHQPSNLKIKVLTR